MKRGILWAFPALAGMAATVLAEPMPPTEGAFAVELSSRLALGQGFILEEEEAIAALTRIGIHPDGGWKADRAATNAFVSEIHDSIEKLLENVSREMNLPVAHPSEARARP